jgi:hypothetical protein
MAKTKSTTKPRRRPQPASPRIPWKHRGIPDKPAAQRRMLHEMARRLDDKAVSYIVYWALMEAVRSDERADLAELQRIKASGIYVAGAKKMSLCQSIPLDGLTKAEVRRLKTMTSAQFRAFAKRKAKERARKAVQP